MEKSEGKRSMWLVFAVLSAVFAALTSILAKVGIDNVNSNLATAIRTLVVLVMAWVMVFATGAQAGLGQITQRSLVFRARPGCAITAPSSSAACPRWCPSIK